MALTIVDNRSILSECDSVTGWTATDGPTLFTASPDPIEAGGCLAMQVSNAVEDAYTAITSDDYSGGGTLSIWMQDRAGFVSTANVGQAIQVGDGTNRIAYSVGGSDGTAFRHDVGPVKWANFLLDLANKPANFVAIAGAEANLNEAAITQVGVYFETNVKSVGGADNCFWDIIRWADPGVGIEVYGGTSGTPETLLALAILDRSTGNQQAYGAIRELSTGVYGIQANINLGDLTSTNATYINIDTETLTWEDRGLSAANYYRFAVAGNTTGVTQVNILNSTLSVAGAASASFDTSDANVDDFNATGTSFINFGDGVTTGGSGQDWTLTKFIDCGQITTNGADFSGTSISGYTGTAGTGALLYNISADPDGELDDSTFEKGTVDTHAIQFGTNAPATMTLRGLTFTGYNTTNGETTSNAAVLYFPDKGTDTAWTVNAIGVSGTISYRKARTGDTVTIVADPVTITITATDADDGSNIQNAQVLVWVANGTNFPYQASVTITGTGTTATVTHTAHGMATNDNVVIEGCTPDVYNGAYTITVTGVNTYTFTTNETIASSPATGSPTSTFAFINTLTDVAGEASDSRVVSSNQLVNYRVRKYDISPYYRQAAGQRTVDSVLGLSIGASLISDE